MMQTLTQVSFVLSMMAMVSACSTVRSVEAVSRMSPAAGGPEHLAMLNPGEMDARDKGRNAQASLWNGGRQSLLGDRRAILRGDILTVVVEIDDQAQMSNSSSRNRNGSESLGIPSLLGIPQRLNNIMPDGASLDSAVSLNSTSASSGDGSISRNERLTLRVAATITDVLPNGILRIRGSQEVRVNFEVRELLVEGYVRPEDISRKNEITYDKIASARISYGGRGLISDVQSPRIGQQFVDQILPF